MRKGSSRNRAESGVCPHCGWPLRSEGKEICRLSRRQGLWEVVFDGGVAQFKHEKGAEYVARLLKERGPIHALYLTTKAAGSAGGKRRSEASLREVIELGGTVQERSASLDEVEARQALVQRRRQLEAIAADEKAPARRRDQAREDIAEIVKFLRSQPGRPTNNAQRAVRAVRMAIKRFYGNLSRALDERGRRNPVLAAFAEHLYEHLLVPSGRYSSPRARQARGELAGCFVYERPAGRRWILECGGS